jgi:hypothetical protein
LERLELFTAIRSEYQKGTGLLKKVGIGREIILKWLLKNQGMVAQSEFLWLCVGLKGGLL